MSAIGGTAIVTADWVKAEAAAAGFDLCGIAPAAHFPELDFLDDWLARGFAGEMQYLQRSAARRADVRAVLPSARSVIALGVVYNARRPYSIEHADTRTAAIARYAWGDDYHEVIGGRLARLVARLGEAAGEAFESRAYVDTGPVQERVYAQRAGLGWIGKNTCLINPAIGSWVFLAVDHHQCAARRQTFPSWITAERARCVSRPVRPERWSSPACWIRPGACRT